MLDVDNLKQEPACTMQVGLVYLLRPWLFLFDSVTSIPLAWIDWALLQADTNTISTNASKHCVANMTLGLSEDIVYLSACTRNGIEGVLGIILLVIRWRHDDTTIISLMML